MRRPRGPTLHLNGGIRYPAVPVCRLSGMPFDNGEVFAGYVIQRLLGTGGMGEVYLAQHPRLPRHDALKVLSLAATADQEFQARFKREAELAATLWHPTSSAFSIVASSTAGCGSRWSTWTAPTRAGWSGSATRTACQSKTSPKS
ncbi:hypothetical protein NIIDMKKI_55220 [Mycobacterium kansasii]|uniref:non-specific serine/threonine protein kinase n=1 Tax=Mycobacterium kansasii TaxID=1768 RepID=A0A7G1IH07_MYCKA|nr:hypothetical protein NIIDMKKI_55220 [Mycobacterium kansasii]